MTIRQPIVILTLLLASVTSSFSNGKFYIHEGTPPGVPYQRALLMFDKGRETLILQSRFIAADRTASDASVGWVIPAPAVPELNSLTSEQGEQLFTRLALASRPDVTRLPLPLLTSLLAIGLFLVICHVKKIRMIFRWSGLFCWLVLAVFLGPTLHRSRTLVSDIDVIHEQDVGVYHAKVVQARDGSSLIGWLNENGFQFQSSDQSVLDLYLKRGWVFAVVKLGPRKKEKMPHSHGAMPDPLIIRFESHTPVYPLALTSTIGMGTEVTLYVLSRSKWRAQDRLSLRFAARLNTAVVSNSSLASTSVLKPWEEELTYLCRFSGALRADQMSEDLELQLAREETPYREHRTLWW